MFGFSLNSLSYSSLYPPLESAMDASALKSAEMQQFLNEEKQRAMINELVGKITSSCWDKCITSTPGSKFSSSETNCLTNCAQRYMDMSVLIIKRFQSIN